MIHGAGEGVPTCTHQQHQRQRNTRGSEGWVRPVITPTGGPTSTAAAGVVVVGLTHRTIPPVERVGRKMEGYHVARTRRVHFSTVAVVASVTVAAPPPLSLSSVSPLGNQTWSPNGHVNTPHRHDAREQGNGARGCVARVCS